MIQLSREQEFYKNDELLSKVCKLTNIYIWSTVNEVYDIIDGKIKARTLRGQNCIINNTSRAFQEKYLLLNEKWINKTFIKTRYK